MRHEFDGTVTGLRRDALGRDVMTVACCPDGDELALATDDPDARAAMPGLYARNVAVTVEVEADDEWCSRR